MNNEKFSVFSHFLFSYGGAVKKYLWFVAAVYVIAGAICAGLYLDAFSFVDSVNAYILAEEILHSMIRSTTAAVLMILLLDLAENRNKPSC